jgi:hypothetical protein
MGGEVVMLMGLRCGRMVMVTCRVGIGADPALWGDGLGEPMNILERRLLGEHLKQILQSESTHIPALLSTIFTSCGES